MWFLACLTCWWGGSAIEGAGDTGISCKWLLTAGGGTLAAAIAFLVMWLKAVLKELKDEQVGRLNDLKEQFRSATGK